jgi:tetratricopeptide (TPR) repeat protein
MLIAGFLYFLRPQLIRAVSFNAVRIKNTFAYYIFQAKPHFYYLEMEKNGKDLQVSVNEALELTYRDEVVVKAIVSDDITGKYTTVNIEGLGKGGNDLGVLMRGVDLVNKIMQKDIMSQGEGTISDYRIRVNYQNEVLAAVPMRVVISPQDWLRFAKDTTNVKVQIEYLKKAIALNEEDTGVRKILAGIYLQRGRPDDAIAQYKSILAIKPDDKTALGELIKCYIRTKQYNDAIDAARALIKISPQDVEAYAGLGYSLQEKGLWDRAIDSYGRAVKIDPDNYPLRLKLGDAYVHQKKMMPAVEQYKYIVEHSRDADLARLALGDIYLKTKKYDEAIRYYQEVIKNQPRLAAAYANLASAYAGKGKGGLA